MRNRTLRNRMKAAFLTAALIGSTLMGAIPAQAEPESGADGEQVPKVITTDGAKVELPIEQYLNISKAATAKWPTLEGTYTVKREYNPDIPPCRSLRSGTQYFGRSYGSIQ